MNFLCKDTESCEEEDLFLHVISLFQKEPQSSNSIFINGILLIISHQSEEWKQ